MRLFKYVFAALLLTFSWFGFVAQGVSYWSGNSEWYGAVGTLVGALVTTALVASLMRSFALRRRLDAHLERVEAIEARYDTGDRSDELFAEIRAASAEWKILEAEAKRIF